jgi:hypothetical protein
MNRTSKRAIVFALVGSALVLIYVQYCHVSKRNPVSRSTVHYDRASVRNEYPVNVRDDRSSPEQRAAREIKGNAASEAPQYKERQPGEWDGMLVDMTVQPGCVAEMPCGLARACVEGKCVACESDSDCRPGEGCVLDHCLIATKIQCRSSKQCSSTAKCVLSGYSGDVRGNADMISRCVSPTDSFGNKLAARPTPPFGAPESESSRNKGFADEIRRARANATDQ